MSAEVSGDGLSTPTSIASITDGASQSGRLRIAMLAPPMEAVPPLAYGGTERVVAVLASELSRRGHSVTVFASGDSRVPCELVPIVPVSLWSTGYRNDVSAYIALGMAEAWRQADRFDVIHSHVEGLGFLMARHCGTPVLSTMHGRLDTAGMPDLLRAFPDVPLVAISDSQRRWAPGANWVGTVHHGLHLEQMPFGDRAGEHLAFIGRCAKEKGVAEAIDLARRSRLPMRMAAKVYSASEQELFEREVRPAIAQGVVEFLGEIAPGQRDPLFSTALATVMLGGWPEPFGLVAIESLACGTPVIARRAGALPEIIEHGVDGFLVDDVEEATLAVRLVGDLDRDRIRRRALERFNAGRMAERYEAIYRALLESRQAIPAASTRHIA